MGGQLLVSSARGNGQVWCACSSTALGIGECNEPLRSRDGVHSLSFGHRLPGVLGSRLEREKLGQVANSSFAAADSSEQHDCLVVCTGRDHAESQCTCGIAGGDTCENRRRDHRCVAQRTLNELEADVPSAKGNRPQGWGASPQE